MTVDAHVRLWHKADIGLRGVNVVKRTKVYGDLNFCQRLGSTIFPFRHQPLSPIVVPRWPNKAGADFLILGLSFLSPARPKQR